jgi:hypothetical protein
MSLDEFLADVLTEPADSPPCPCSHPFASHRHPPDGLHCIRACGCRVYRGVAVQDVRSAATGTEALRAAGGSFRCRPGW